MSGKERKILLFHKERKLTNIFNIPVTLIEHRSHNFVHWSGSHERSIVLDDTYIWSRNLMVESVFQCKPVAMSFL